MKKEVILAGILLVGMIAIPKTVDARVVSRPASRPTVSRPVSRPSVPRVSKPSTTQPTP